MNNRRLGQLDQQKEDKRVVLAVLMHKAKLAVDTEDHEESADHRVVQRHKQILFGKVTPGYRRYIAAVPKYMRHEDNHFHPQTPRAEVRCSKRHWDLLMQIWRRQLHLWDVIRTDDDLRRMVTGVFDYHKVELVDTQHPGAPIDPRELQRNTLEALEALRAINERVELQYGKSVTPDAPVHARDEVEQHLLLDGFDTVESFVDA
jgi:hypothetical protein